MVITTSLKTPEIDYVARLPIGQRVAYWRQHRRWSQQLFADLLGRSKSWVEKTERGARKLDRLSVIVQVADVLDIDVALLVATRPTPASCVACGRPVAADSRAGDR